MQNNVVIFLWNVYTNRFIYMSDKLKVLSGLEPSQFMEENGVQFSFSRMHPNQVEALLLFNQLAFKHFAENALYDSKKFVTCVNYLFKNGNNEYVQVLQRTIILEADENNNPSLCISFIHYVGHIKKYDSVGCIISTHDKISIYDYDYENKCIKAPKTFSINEKKIIALLAEGCDTKSISQKLFISPHTVNTHRKNLIKKTNCIDSTGVVAFARLINLI
jgi:DNA-binding CsgD family transcriptional regulator